MIKRRIGMIVNVVLLLVTAALYPRLPDQMPTHWDLHGEVNGTMPKAIGAFLPSLIALMLTALLPALRRIDPRKPSYERFDDTFYLIINAVALLFAIIQGLTVAIALGYSVDMVRSLLFALGVMFAVMGNYLPRIRSNWWMGIRTPWTLDNEEVWRRTHRLAGRLFVAGGLVVMAGSLLPVEAAGVVAIVAICIAALVPAIYSYFIWRTEREERPHA